MLWLQWYEMQRLQRQQEAERQQQEQFARLLLAQQQQNAAQQQLLSGMRDGFVNPALLQVCRCKVFTLPLLSCLETREA